MKKITYLIISFTLLIFFTACADYKPIFGSSNFQFNIAKYSIEGNERLGRKIYNRLYNMSKSNEGNLDSRSIEIMIEVSKEKNATTKGSTGKILEYRIKINCKIIVNDFLTSEEILNQNFSSSLPFKVQDQYSETIKLESKSTENLMNTIYQDLLIKLTENIATK